MGGIWIPHDQHAVGHSDADVLLHAITDSILGAAGAGDIGQLFPNNDPENKNRDSRQMLQIAWQPLADAGWRLLNLDCVVFAQSPKMLEYWPAIKQEIVAALTNEHTTVSALQIGVKAKTGEHVGLIGQMEAIAAQCVSLLLAPESE